MPRGSSILSGEGARDRHGPSKRSPYNSRVLSYEHTTRERKTIRDQRAAGRRSPVSRPRPLTQGHRPRPRATRDFDASTSRGAVSRLRFDVRCADRRPLARCGIDPRIWKKYMYRLSHIQVSEPRTAAYGGPAPLYRVESDAPTHHTHSRLSPLVTVQLTAIMACSSTLQIPPLEASPLSPT